MTSEISTYEQWRAAARSTDVSTAQQQFVKNLVRQARKEEHDRELYEIWKARHVEVQRSIARERKVLWAAAGVGVLGAVGVGWAILAFLMSFGLTLGAAILLALLLAGGTGCGCTITVIHVCGH